MARPEDQIEPFIGGRPAKKGETPRERAERLVETYRQEAQRIADFYEHPADPDAALAVAVSRGDTEQALRLIAQGADVNQAAGRAVPLIHEAIGLGHKAIAEAMLNTGRCDLTLRDSAGRLASEVADLVARDHEFAERLAEEQARQFREKNLDPRRPDHPDYGNWTWEE